MPFLRFFALFLAVAFPISRPSLAQGEFSGQGENVVRIESEIKLFVPHELEEQVWAWLEERYADCGWLSYGDSTFTAEFGDENFRDVYFDTPSLDLLSEQSGIRHRSRQVLSGAAMGKDGRQLLQIKLNQSDPTGLARGEIKFRVAPSTRLRTVDDGHAMIGLVQKDQREEMKARVRDLGLDPYSMQPILTVLQNRRRVYVSDQHGAFATLTLDRCSTDSWGSSARWTEIELELNEVRYTEANEEGRQAMEAVNNAIQSDLLQAFPSIVQDQTPKYNKAFDQIVSTAWVPVRPLIGMGLDLGDFYALLFVVLGGVATGIVLLLRRKRTSVQQS